MRDNFTLLQILFPVFDLVFDFWPVLILSAAVGRRYWIRNMLISWGFWAIIRVVLFFNPEPIQASLLIPEPLSTILFFLVGVVLGGLGYGQGIWQRARFKSKVQGVSGVEDLQQLSPREFEDLVVETYTAFGHRAKRTGATGDHGVDVVVYTRGGEKHIVQCKKWRGSVGEPVVRDFYGAISHEKADKGVIITSGKFTAQAREWARGKPISLVDGEEFLKVWRRAQTKNKAG